MKKAVFYYYRRTGIAKMIDNGKGVLWIRGKFKDHLPNPYFKVYTNIIPTLVNMFSNSTVYFWDIFAIC